MSGRSTNDAGNGIRDAIAKLEARVESISTALMGTEEFSKTANAASSVQMRVQRGMSSHMARQLALFNMPSREDINALAERVMTMDERLVRIEALLQRITPEDAARPAGGPPRTKKPAAKTSQDT
ncbi:MAG: hypothetical protein AAF511_04920 [Pseudomonadota bacterium]